MKGSPALPKVVEVRSTFRATDVAVAHGILRLILPGLVELRYPVAALGEPWKGASAKVLSNVRLRVGGTWLYWDDLEEAVILDEWLPSVLAIRPGALLAKRGRGKKASPAKARAAQANGSLGGRPRKKSAA